MRYSIFHLSLVLGFCFLGLSQSNSAPRSHAACATATSAVERLRCYDAASGAQIATHLRACRGVASELYRLDCYDTAQTPAAQQAAGRSRVPVAATVPFKTVEASVKQESDPAKTTVQTGFIAQDTPWRIEAGGGLMQWMLNTAVEGLGPTSQGDVRWSNGVGGAGPLWHVGVSYSGLLFDSLSLGVEYVGLSADARIRGSFTGSLGLFPISAKARLEGEGRADFVLFNVGWRTVLSPETSLLMGAGIGPGRAALSGDVVSIMPLSPEPTQSAFDLSDWTYGVQAFVAVEKNLTEHLYLLGKMRYLVSSGYPFGQNIHFQSLSTTAGIGIKF